MLSQRIHELRTAKNISQVELAKALGVTKQSVSNWENDNIQPSIEILIKLARFFGVTTDYLLALDDRRFLEVGELSPEKISHLRQIILDMQA